MKIRALKYSGFIILLLTAMCLAGACADKNEPETVYSKFIEIAESGWDRDHTVAFEPWPADSTIASVDTFILDLTFRASARRQLGTIPAIIVTEDEDGVISSDTVNVDFSQTADGKEVRRQYGIKEVTLRIDSGFKLKDGYAVTVSPLADRDRSRGLLNIGAVLKKIKK